jgi:hypothetical protein
VQYAEAARSAEMTIRDGCIGKCDATVPGPHGRASRRCPRALPFEQKSQRERALVRTGHIGYA